MYRIVSIQTLGWHDCVAGLAYLGVLLGYGDDFVWPLSGRHRGWLFWRANGSEQKRALVLKLR